MRFAARLSITASAAAAACLATASVASAAVAQIEQINRATGPNGAFSLITGPAFGIPNALTDDGRFAAFTTINDSGEPAYDGAYANPGYGLFVRDIVQNTTTKLASDQTLFTGLDRTERLFSFVTKDRLSPADTNDLPDLYAYERTTGLKLLVSRQGLLGPALGLTSYGSVLENPRYAVFGTAAGVFRRDLLTGKNTRVSGGNFRDAFYDDPTGFGDSSYPIDGFASADGKVVATSEGIFTPTATYPLEPGQFGGTARTFVASSGDKAVWQTSDPTAPLKVRNLKTGAVTSPALPAELASRIAVNLFRLTDDGKSAIVASFSLSPFGGHLDKWNLETGQLTSAGPYGTLPSDNSKYYVNGGGGRNAVLTVAATPGNALPGSIQVPSPNAYLNLYDECTFDEPARAYRITTNGTQTLPPVSTVRIRATRPNGTLLLDQTLHAPQTPEDDFEYAQVPVGNEAFVLDVTATLVDGRTATERTTRPALPAGQSCLGPQFP